MSKNVRIGNKKRKEKSNKLGQGCRSTSGWLQLHTDQTLQPQRQARRYPQAVEPVSFAAIVH